MVTGRKQAPSEAQTQPPSEEIIKRGQGVADKEGLANGFVQDTERSPSKRKRFAQRKRFSVDPAVAEAHDENSIGLYRPTTQGSRTYLDWDRLKQILRRLLNRVNGCKKVGQALASINVADVMKIIEKQDNSEASQTESSSNKGVEKSQGIHIQPVTTGGSASSLSHPREVTQKTQVSKTDPSASMLPASDFLSTSNHQMSEERKINEDTASQVPSSHIETIALEQQSKDVHTIDAASTQHPSNESHSTSIPNDSDADFKYKFYMAIHQPTEAGGVRMRMAQLDTGSSLNVISHDVINDLKIPMDPYLGFTLRPFNGSVWPIGQVRLEWHVQGREKTYTDIFAVLPNDFSEDFDMLLGRETIERIGFYKRNRTVFFTESANTGVIPLARAVR